MWTRRDFVRTSAAAGVGFALVPTSAMARLAKPEPMNLLILGGTGFLGPHFVREAMSRGHTVTLFNRGKTNPHLFPDLEKLRGDRRGSDLSALEGDRRWDAVVDTSGYVPRIVTESASLLKGRCGQYQFISTISVYGNRAEAGMTEDAEVAMLEDPTVEQITGMTYGPLKALCEQAARNEFPGAAPVIRPGLIVGPGDPTDRFTYWPVRVRRGGRVLAPGDGEDHVQVIDVRDLAAFMVRLLEQKTDGTYHAITPAGAHTMRGVLSSCKEACGSDAEFEWVPADVLAAKGVRAWQHMPAWLPRHMPGFGGVGQISAERAVAAGLTHRPMVDTARDTLSWVDTLDEARRGQLVAGARAGISPEREAEVLVAWDAERED